MMIKNILYISILFLIGNIYAVNNAILSSESKIENTIINCSWIDNENNQKCTIYSKYKIRDLYIKKIMNVLILQLMR